MIKVFFEASGNFKNMLKIKPVSRPAVTMMRPAKGKITSSLEISIDQMLQSMMAGSNIIKLIFGFPYKGIH